MGPAEKISRSRRIAILALLLIFALAIRSLRAFQEPVVNPDAIRFIEQAQELARDPLQAIRAEVYHPLHSAAGLLAHGLLRPFFATDRAAWLAAMQAVGIVAGSIVALQIVALARLLGARFWPAVAAALVWIVGRRTSAYGADGLSDMLFLALFAAAMITGLHALRFRHPRTHSATRQLRLFFLSGLLAGLAYLTRPEGLAAPIILLATLAILALPRRKESPCHPVALSPCHAPPRRFKLLPRRPLPARLAIAAALCLCVGVVIPAAPYMLAIHGITGKKTLLPAAANAPLAPPGPADRSVGPPRSQADAGVFAAAGLRFIAGPPIRHPKNLLVFRDNLYKMVMELWETFGFAPTLIWLLAIPLAPQFWGRARLRLPVIIWFFLWYAIMFWLVGRAGYLDGRHTLPVQLLGYALLAMAFVVWARPMRWWMAWYRRRPGWSVLPAWRRWSGWPAIFTAGAAVLAMLPGAILLAQPPAADRLFVRQAADWVAANTLEGTLICDRERLVGYYSGHPYKLWEGSAENPALEEIAAARANHPHIILTAIYLPERGDLPHGQIGPYRAIAAFQSASAAAHDVLVLYALPNDALLRDVPAPILTTRPATDAPTSLP